MTALDEVPGRAVAQRRLVALVQVLGLAVWFSATAVVPSLRQEWGLSGPTAVWLTASVQIGFVVGAVGSGVLGVADRWPPQRVMGTAAAAAAGCTLVFALLADGMVTAVPLRLLTGVCLAGVYPVGMKLTASWAPSADRGRAFGVLIGSLTLGSALPHLLSSVDSLPWRAVMSVAALLALSAAVVAHALVRPGPLLAVGGRPRGRLVLAGFRDRGPRLANLGYFGHMWELYAFWTWLPAYVTLSRGGTLGTPDGAVSLVVFVTIGVAGVAGCLLGGWASDRFGRSPAAVTAMVVSGGCCLLSPLAFVAAPAVLLVFLFVWGAAVIADSGVFSTALSETADQRYVGTALTVQTAVGFTLTVVTIQLLPLVAGITGWRYALLFLAPGPLLGAVAMARFRLAAPRSAVRGG